MRESQRDAQGERVARVPTVLGGLAVTGLFVLAACDAVPGSGGEPGETAPLPPPMSGLVEVASPAGEGSGEPNLVAGADGRVYLSWLEPGEGDAYALRFSVLNPGAGSPEWSPPRTILERGDFFVNWADFPSMFALDDGTLAVHWLRRTGPGAFDYDVEVAWSTDGGESWSDPMVPHRDGTLSEHGFVSLFPRGDGALGAVWLDGRKYAGWDEEAGRVVEPGRPDDPEMTLRFTTMTPGGLGPEVLLDDRVCECCQTSAVVTSEGPVVFYRDRTEDEVRDISVVRHVDGRWTDPEPLHEDGWLIPACPVNGPMAAADGRRVAVAWFTAAGDEPRVRLAFSSDAGATFGPPVRIDDGNPAGRVATTLLPAGDALVTWVERAGDGAEIRIRRVAPDGSRGASETVAAGTAARAGGFPRMVRSEAHLVFAWTDARPEARDQREVRVALAGAGERVGGSAADESGGGGETGGDTP